MRSHFLLSMLAAMASPAMAATLSSLNHVGNYELAFVNEASAVTYNRDTGTLFTIGDEGEAMYQMSTTGQLINSMSFDNSGPRGGGRALDDPEGLAYIGNNTFLIADERYMSAKRTEYHAGTKVGQNVMPSYAFAAYDGNTGLEGVSYDPINNSLWGVKELGPVAVFEMSGWGTPEAVVRTNPFDLRFLNRAGITQVSDIYVMANSGAFSLGDPRRTHILILTRDFDKVLEVDRSGMLIDTLDISSIGRDTIEGMTMDDMGNLYLVSEGFGGSNSNLHVFGAVPEPSTWALGVAGLACMFAVRRIRRRKRN